MRRRDSFRAAALVAAPLFVRWARAADTPRFALGVASGLPRPDRIVMWTRVTGPDLPAELPVRWEMADDDAFTRIVKRGTDLATVDDAHTEHAEASGLDPDRVYWYRFETLGQRSRVGRTRTAPAGDAEGRLQLKAIPYSNRLVTKPDDSRLITLEELLLGFVQKRLPLDSSQRYAKQRPGQKFLIQDLMQLQV